VDKSRFFSIIASARQGSQPAQPSADPEALRAVLAELPTEEVIEFVTEFTTQMIRLNRWSIWAAGYVIAGGMSDDGFHYFRSWLIGKGSYAVEQALTDPDGLAPYVDNPDVDNEGLEHVALEVLEQRGVRVDPRIAVDGLTDGEPTGEPFDENTVADLYPSLLG
jgi:hypothetical protein